MIADHLILGGGTAGCVLAARLSEDRHRTVVLVEAGRDIAAGDMPNEIRSRYPGRAYLDPRNIWSTLTARMGYSRGNLRLASPDHEVEPEVDFRLLSDVRDLDRLKSALRMGTDVLRDPGMNGFRDIVFPSSYSPRVARIAVPGAGNAMRRGLLAGLLDLAGPLRAALVHSAITLGTTMDALLRDDDALGEFVRRHVGGTWHPSGTCRMGAASDPMAVTSPQGEVYGVNALRVCDASLMPSIPCANTNLPTIMIAERIADFIRRGD